MTRTPAEIEPATVEQGRRKLLEALRLGRCHLHLSSKTDTETYWRVVTLPVNCGLCGTSRCIPLARDGRAAAVQEEPGCD